MLLHRKMRKLPGQILRKETLHQTETTGVFLHHPGGKRGDTNDRVAFNYRKRISFITFETEVFPKSGQSFVAFALKSVGTFGKRYTIRVTQLGGG